MMQLTQLQKESIISSAERSLKEIADDLDYFKNPRKKCSWGAIISFMAGAHEHLAVKEYFIDYDIQGFKQNAYLCAQSDLVAKSRGYGGDEMTWDLLLFALLSDSAKAIQAVGMANPRFIRAAGNQPQSIYFWVHMYQLVMLNKMDEVAQRLEKAKTQTKKHKRKELVEGKDFFSLLLAKDKVGLENLILEKAKNDKTDNPWIGGLIAPIPTIEAKLCWLKGIEVEIGHPLVPMELLPVKPLDHYDDIYDFLAPDWVPPKRTFLRSIKHMFFKQ
ncbi:Imm49 family immunity protein [Methylophilus luteus]|uniref:Imm49 family immunity protein n=1 Tax=Methylophilus luteus TaxID=640108 RepID=A0ABW3FBC3_9PROT